MGAARRPPRPAPVRARRRPAARRRRRDYLTLGAKLAQQLDLAVEVGRRVEVLVDAGETEVGDLVECAQVVEHQQPDLGARRLGATEAHGVLDRVGDALDLLERDRRDPWWRRARPADDLGPLERLDATMGLDHGERHLVDALERGEAVLAVRAPSAATHRRTFGGQARVDDLGVVGVAQRAVHLASVHVDSSAVPGAAATGEDAGAAAPGVRRPGAAGPRSRPSRRAASSATAAGEAGRRPLSLDRGADHRTRAIAQHIHGTTSRGIDSGAETGPPRRASTTVASPTPVRATTARAHRASARRRRR